MKRLFVLLVNLLFGIFAFAQDCPICGDWKGVYSSDDGENVKIILRIKKTGDEYSIRQKLVFPNGRVDYTNYEEYTFKVSYSNNDSTLIWWQKFLQEVNKIGKDSDGSYYDKTEIYHRKNVIIKGNKMIHKSWFAHDRMVEIDNWPGHYARLSTENTLIYTRVLFKDEDDW